jgi:hypothetical protein
MSSIIKVDTVQDQDGNNIINENANTITIGKSGDTVQVASGATLVNGVLIWQSVQTTGFTAVKGNAYPCNTTSAAFTVTLPATPSAGDQVQVVDYAGTFDTNALTIDPNGEDIEGGTDNLILTEEREGVILTYIDSTQGWIATSGVNEGTNALADIVSTDFLVIAGGGGGANVGSGGLSYGGGGGGAGGYRTSAGTSGGGAVAESSLTLGTATNYTVTVGAGGSGGPGAANGSDSVFGSITSIGGGRVATSGGSGGGGTGIAASGGSAGTANQGFAGGNGSPPYGSGGSGGGAGGAGNNGVIGTNPATTGGLGVSSSITGTPVTRAVGGAGGQSNADSNGTAGGANTGTGGGGAGIVSGGTQSGGNGGSGIVIIKYPDTFTITNPGGGLTFTTATASGFSVTSFTAGTGTIQLN